MNNIPYIKLDILVIIYYDDTLVFLKDANAYEEHLNLFFYQLRKHYLKIKKYKCAFGVLSV